MILVGLTGGIASGKTTVSDFLRQEGAHIIDADEIAHRLISKGNRAYRPVLDVFGDGVLDEFGEIDRKKLGAIVFAHPPELDRLNQIIHPLVFKELDAEKKRMSKEQPRSIIVFDAPLLIEAQAHQKMDWVLLVYVDEKIQRSRLIKRDALTTEEAMHRIALQMPIDKKRQYSDEIIDNRRPLHKVKQLVHDIYHQLLKRV